MDCLFVSLQLDLGSNPQHVYSCSTDDGLSFRDQGISVIYRNDSSTSVCNTLRDRLSVFNNVDYDKCVTTQLLPIV